MRRKICIFGAVFLWIHPLGVNVNTYKKREFAKSFETANLMDNYYKEEGNYTAMWY